MHGVQDVPDLLLLCGWSWGLTAKTRLNANQYWLSASCDYLSLKLLLKFSIKITDVFIRVTQCKGSTCQVGSMI